jgi:glyoxalase family protein
MPTKGIHHITAISSNAQKTFDFYSGILGLRLVKKTVNFDAPDTYHLYFADEIGSPGTVLTFFPFPNAGTGMRGRGQVTKIYFAVPIASFGYWIERFTTKGVKHESIGQRFSEKYVTFYDPDGLQLELVGSESAHKNVWQDSDVPVDYAIRSFYGAELSVDSLESIDYLLKDVLGYSDINLKHGEFIHRFENKNATQASILDIFVMKGWPVGRDSAGTNHHIAFRVDNEEQQLKVREQLIEAGFHPTEVIDRNYFYSIYFREKNNILFEIATDTPGFLVDEAKESLGTNLKLPAQYEKQREQIEKSLPALHTQKREGYFNSHKNQLDLFKHKFVDNKAQETYILLHGTGGDESEMLELADLLGIKANLLSIRGNVSEHGMNRYFERFPDGRFNLDNIKQEAAKFKDFLAGAIKQYKLDDTKISLLGYSNGANFALSYAFLHQAEIGRIYALHPMATLGNADTDLSNTEIIITYGEKDQYTSEEEVEKLKKIISAAKGKFTLQKFAGGHELSLTELEFLKKHINSQPHELES